MLGDGSNPKIPSDRLALASGGPIVSVAIRERLPRAEPTLELHHPEFSATIGPSRSVKSALMHVIAGLDGIA
ncbi:hypothetical protein EF294_07215 [Gordonia oryzae]|uniref:Uncharacterized protein n=1 Tax=Gordonia oryzae TaxID=2487349 RepID=A0A3N4GPV1_9ACTN|nr:hypothetical protein EF294_07215 [Gordonia oryzae]